MSHYFKKTCFAFMAFFVLAVISGCERPSIPWPSGSKGGAPLQETATPAMFNEGTQAFMDKDFETAARKFGVYSAGNKRTVKGTEALYWQGMSLLELGEINRARTLFAEVRNNELAAEELKAMSLKGAARAYLLERDYARAEESFRTMMVLYPTACARDEALSALIDCANKRGDVFAIRRYREELERDFPDSPYLKKIVDPAQERTSFYVQVGIFTERARAYKMVENIQHKGFEATVKSNGGYYIVQAGSFSSRQAATRHVEELKKKKIQALVKP